MARHVPKETALGHSLRRDLLELVRAEPGISLTQMARRLGCQPSTILWHTGKLRKADLMRSEKVGMARIFYVTAGGRGLREQTIAKVQLNHIVARRIHEVVAQQPGITFHGLQRTLAESMSSLRWHVRRLLDAGLLCLGEDGGREAHFYPSSAPGLPCRAEAGAA